MRREGLKIENREKNYLYHYGRTKGEKGVVFLVKKQRNIQVLDFISTSERVALLTIKIQSKTSSIIQAYYYAPTSDTNKKGNKTEIEKFYRDLEQIMNKYSKHIIFMGDMNAKIGQPDLNENTIMGKYGYGKRNGRG